MSVALSGASSSVRQRSSLKLFRLLTRPVTEVAWRLRLFRWIPNELSNNRWLGSLAWWEWTCHWRQIPDRSVFEVWKVAGRDRTATDLMDGFSSVRDVWKYRGLYVYYLRIDCIEIVWESGRRVAAHRRQAARRRETRLGRHRDLYGRPHWSEIEDDAESGALTHA